MSLSVESSVNIVAIVAHGKNFEIGLENHLLWHIPSDLQRFKKITTGHTVIMGRKTFESVGRPLPGRENVIMTHNQSWKAPEGCLVFSSREAIIKWATEKKLETLFILGGEQIYHEWWDMIRRLYITVVDFTGKADSFFPHYRLQDWQLISEEYCYKSEQNRDQYNSHFMILER